MNALAAIPRVTVTVGPPTYSYDTCVYCIGVAVDGTDVAQRHLAQDDEGGIFELVSEVLTAHPQFLRLDITDAIYDALHGAPAASGIRATTWPEPPGDAAFVGLAGDVVRAVDPFTEADPVAVLLDLLTSAGNVIGSGPHVVVGDTKHPPRLSLVIVGKSSKARKGESREQVKGLIRLADEPWADCRVMGGLSSGEGLIAAVRDPVERRKQVKQNGVFTGETEVEITDFGVEDKRLLVVESEMARTLRVMRREGNVLSAVVRHAWDTGDLRVMTKQEQKATGAHISLICHVTLPELRRELTDTEAANGFGNRFLYACARRSKLLPMPGRLDDATRTRLAQGISAAVAAARNIGEVRFDATAERLWIDVYEELSADRDGLLGAVTSRAEAQTIRLALIYALLDGAAIITEAHLTAALEVWAYCERSAAFIFGDATGDSVADTILTGLQGARDGLTRDELRRVFSGHVTSNRLDDALSRLLSSQRVTVENVESGGRPAQRWRLRP